MTTPLGRTIAQLIQLNGPMSVADYMALCLGDPEHGYYMTRDPLGAAGDFTTAPEVSQMFGEIVGAWLVHLWHSLGSPCPARLVELGPGRGTLMADILRVGSRAPGFLDGVTVHLVEMSPALRRVQEATLRAAGARMFWHGELSDVPDGPTLLVANEFFDALPVRQFLRIAGSWRERAVGLAPDGSLCFGIGAGRLADGPDAPDGAVLETSPARDANMAQVVARFGQSPGAMLVIDYGHTQPGFGESLQAVRHHRYTDLLTDPGEADLTSHVDFAALAAVARSAGAAVHGPMPQGEFLLRLGIGARAERLAQGKSAAEAAALQAQLERLTAPDQMGTLFKVMAVTDPSLRPPPFDS